jgi:hypothetical protein
MAGGASRGERRRRPSYKRGSGEPWRTGAHFAPENAEKLLDWCDAADLSVAAMLDKLIEMLPTDPKTGLPVGWPSGPQQEVIRLNAS